MNTPGSVSSTAERRLKRVRPLKARAAFAELTYHFRLSTYRRILDIQLGDHQAAFLWGPRKVGKTTFLHQQFPAARFYDLLNTEVKTQLLLRPALFREEVLAHRDEVVIVDEVQKVPPLLDEVHWCVENTATQFISAPPCATRQYADPITPDL